MEAWNPYKFTNAEEVVTILVLLTQITVLVGIKLAPCRYKRRMVFWPLLLFWIFTILSATYLGRREVETGRLRLELFWTIKKAWTEHRGIYWHNIIGNILLFVPLGFLLPLADRHLESGLITTLTGAVVSFLVEITQYMTGTGLCEWDDLIHNTLGTFTGYQFFVVSCHLAKRIRNRQYTGNENHTRLWGLSLTYLIGLCLLFAGLLYSNKPDWTGVFY